MPKKSKSGSTATVAVLFLSKTAFMLWEEKIKSDKSRYYEAFSCPILSEFASAYEKSTKNLQKIYGKSTKLDGIIPVSTYSYRDRKAVGHFVPDGG